MLKRVSAVLLAVAMLLSMACTISVVSADPAGPALTISSSHETANRGEEVVFTIGLENLDVELTALAIEVVVDDEVLEFKDKGLYLVEGSDLVTPQADNIFAWASDEALPYDPDLGLASITYTVLEDAVLGDTTIEVNALEAADNGEGANVADVVIASGSVTLPVECTHNFEGATAVPPEAETSYEEAQHTYECIYEDCEEVSYEDCDFEWSEDLSYNHTDDQDGQDVYVCTVCEYECVETIPMGHEIVIGYEAATGTVDGTWYDVCIICGEGDETPITAGHPGTDVPETAWYYNYAQYCRATGLMVGNNGIFNPTGTMTRGGFASVVARIYYGSTDAIPDVTEYTLSDLEGKWYGPHAQAMVDLGIIAGSGGRFNGDAALNTAAAISLLHRVYVAMYGEAEISFGPSATITDMDTVPAWFVEDVEWAAETGLVAGDAQGRLNPLNPCKRQQQATLITKYDVATKGVIILSPPELATALGQDYFLG